MYVYIYIYRMFRKYFAPNIRYILVGGFKFPAGPSSSQQVLRIDLEETVERVSNLCIFCERTDNQQQDFTRTTSQFFSTPNKLLLT